MHQAGRQFEVPREGVELKPEIDLEELQKYLGTYLSPDGLELTVLIRNQRLALRVPNGELQDLHPPDEEGRWASRTNSEITIAFKESDSGAVVGMRVYRTGGQPAIRLGRSRSTSPPLPTVAQIMELRGFAGPGSGIAAIKTMRSVGRIRFPQSASQAHS